MRNSLTQRGLGATVDQVDTDGGALQSAEVIVSYSDRTWTVTDEKNLVVHTRPRRRPGINPSRNNEVRIGRRSEPTFVGD